MKKVTRLLKRGNNKKAKSATDYNVFDSNTCNTKEKTTKNTPTTEPSVHNYNKTITPLATKSKAHKLQLQSKSQLPPDVNINYASLNRIRKQRKRKRNLFLFLCCFCSACKSKRYKGFWQPTRKNPKQRYWSVLRLWLLQNCCCIGCSNCQQDTGDDDDIDGKFAAYICEMKEREGTEQMPVQPQIQVESTPNLEYLVVVEANENSSIETLIPTQNRELTIRGNELKGKLRIWTWDDSLRSNSDRFLETLEHDSSMSHVVIESVHRPVLATSMRGTLVGPLKHRNLDNELLFIF